MSSTESKLGRIAENDRNSGVRQGNSDTLQRHRSAADRTDYLRANDPTRQPLLSTQDMIRLLDRQGHTWQGIDKSEAGDQGLRTTETSTELHRRVTSGPESASEPRNTLVPATHPETFLMEGEASGSNRPLEASHIPDRNEPSRHETIDTINDKISKIEYSRLAAFAKAARALMYRADILADTKASAEKVATNIAILNKQSNNFIHYESKYDQKAATEAYNSLKDQYNSDNLNYTIKEWYKRVGFDYAQDDQ